MRDKTPTNKIPTVKTTTTAANEITPEDLANVAGGAAAQVQSAKRLESSGADVDQAMEAKRAHRRY